MEDPGLCRETLAGGSDQPQTSPRPASDQPRRRAPQVGGGEGHTAHRVGLVLAAVELVAVVEDVLVGGVEAGLHTVLHHLTGPGGTLQLLDLRRIAANGWL